tara:strand:- start:1679 stop:2002 length:324 start_codon:yes stop_codon:yes gene_type:complete
MNEDKNSWSEITDDISDVTKKIKNKIDEEDLVEDLKSSFRETVESTSEIMNSLLAIVDKSIKDKDIRKDTRETVQKINDEIFSSLVETKNKISNVYEDSSQSDNEEE